MKSLLIDVDEVLAHSTMLDEINSYLHANYKFEDFTEYYLDDVIGNDEEKAKFYEVLKTKDLYQNAKVFDGAVQALKELNEKYDIYICSACVMFCCPYESGKYFQQKFDFIVRNFPFLDPDKIILTGAKNLFEADVQIDDRLKNLKGNVKTKLLFDSYHNKNISKEELEEKNVIRVHNWEEIKKILL